MRLDGSARAPAKGGEEAARWTETEKSPHPYFVLGERKTCVWWRVKLIRSEGVAPRGRRRFVLSFSLSADGKPLGKCINGGIFKKGTGLAFYGRPHPGFMLLKRRKLLSLFKTGNLLKVHGAAARLLPSRLSAFSPQLMIFTYTFFKKTNK